MTLPAQKYREVIFQLLYSYDTGFPTDDSMVDLLSSELEVSKKTVREAQSYVYSLMQHKKEIDALIAKTSHSYAFERIQTVERNILRIGIYELLHDKPPSPLVIIAEARRLCKKFSTKESAAFVNAILDAIYKASVGENSDLKSVLSASKDLQESEKLAHEASQQPPSSKHDQGE